MSAEPHATVLKAETLAAIAPRAGGLYVDATFGAGGFSRALLNAAACEVVALDRDPEAIVRARQMESEYGARFRVIEARFGDLEAALAGVLGGRQVPLIDGIAFDVGVSSPQLDEAERGFSFMRDGPLDMRMGGEGETAADLVNTLSADELADILKVYGEEMKAKAIARFIVRRRSERPFTRTLDLAACVAAAVRAKAHERIHPATRTFQALRIAVNDELGELARGLGAAERLLIEGGRLAVISFHSLEDRIVKLFLLERSGGGPRPSRHLPESPAQPEPSFRLLKKSPIQPSEAEMALNPRARSAKLRAGERTAAPAFPLNLAKFGLEVRS